MSTINHDAHNVVEYTAKSKALTGQRLAKVTYKTDKDTGIKKESKCVSIPLVSTEEVTENLGLLTPAFISFIQDTQDKLVRELVDSGAVLVSDSDISMAAVASYLESSNESGRLTKESIGAWFDSTIADSLTVAIADKLGVSDNPTLEQNHKLDVMVATYKDKLAALAGGKTSYTPDMASKLLRAIEIAGVDDALAVKFSARLNAMISAPAIDILAAL